jgi:quercetin dioxygenase-like cupin family protein
MTAEASHPDSSSIESVVHEGEVIGLIVRTGASPAATKFLTSPDDNLQLGYVVYPAGGEIQRHIHLPLERELVGTAEVVIVKEGRCEVDFYTESKELLTTREMTEGDVMLLLRGGHGFRMSEDTVLFEVKQGPYTGLDEKERF